MGCGPGIGIGIPPGGDGGGAGIGFPGGGPGIGGRMGLATHIKKRTVSPATMIDIKIQKSQIRISN